jgi:hypothetical protein
MTMIDEHGGDEREAGESQIDEPEVETSGTGEAEAAAEGRADAEDEREAPTERLEDAGVEGDAAAWGEPTSRVADSSDPRAQELDRPPRRISGQPTSGGSATLWLYRLLRSWPGRVGLILMVTSTVTFVFFGLIELVAEEVHPYFGLFHFLVLPPLGMFGAGLVFIGFLRERRKRRIAEETGEDWIRLDVTRTRVQQRLLLVSGLFSGVLVFVVAIGGYQAHEFTDSVGFCGELCHVVMEPEYVAYQNSAHARVTCAECHVGSGAQWYVRSKISGLYQVYAVLRDIYPRPIPTPIESLRPAPDTCEQCHWPRHFFGARLKTFTHYPSEGGEEPWVINMLLNIGGGDPEKGYTRGIHWHMNIANGVQYIARDEKRQDIPWIRVVDELGNVTVYEDVENPLAEEEIEEMTGAGHVRTMDCLDCHNRPSHVFKSPVELVNQELLLGNLDPSMPEIKLLTVELLATEYETKEEAALAITDGLRDAYSSNYPEYYADNQRQVDEAAALIKRVYSENMFPEMKVRWRAYPDDIGHRNDPGCFRCHAGNHQSSDGRVISTDCNSCHTILSQGTRGQETLATTAGVSFIHPLDGEVIDYPILCNECHDGALGLTF